MHRDARKLRPSLLALSLFSAGAFAQTFGGLDDLRQREERERLEQDILQQLEAQQQRERAAQPAPEVPATALPDLAGHAFPVERIVLQGEPRPPRSRRRILARYEGRTLGAQEMFELVRDLTNDYAAQGFVTTTVVLLPQNLSTGTLALGVQWGRVKGWRFDGQPVHGLRQHALQAMLPRIEDEVLDIGAIDQAVEALNNGRQSAQVSIVPADEAGWSWIDVRMATRFPIGGNLGADNSGPSDKLGDGRFRSTAGLSLRGIGAETWSLGGTRRHYFDGNLDVEESRNIALSMPLGYWDFEWRRGDSRYERLIETIFADYPSEGTSRDLSLKVGRTLARSKEGKTAVGLRVQRKDNENFIGGQRLDVSSKVYTDVVLEASRVDRLAGGALYADIGWSRGTRWLGANDVAIDTRDGVTRALFYKYAGNVRWNRGFALGSRRLDFAVRGGWQYTPRNLLSANKLTLGDEYTVRGFKGNPVYGDKGAYLSNTLSMGLFGGVTGFIGADIGAVSDNGPAFDRGNKVISGWAAGFRANFRHANISLTYAEPMQAPPRATGAPRPPRDVLYATATLTF